MAEYETIWKFPLHIVEHQQVEIPGPGVLLDIQFQGPQLCMWVGVTPGRPRAVHNLCVVGTGMPMPNFKVRHLRTVQQPGTPFVWHVFQGVLPSVPDHLPVSAT